MGLELHPDYKLSGAYIYGRKTSVCDGLLNLIYSQNATYY